MDGPGSGRTPELPHRYRRLARARERLQARLLTATQEVIRQTGLFQSRPELGEPYVEVNVYPQSVRIVILLTEDQYAILPLDGRKVALEGFADEARDGTYKLAESLRLEVVREPGPNQSLGYSQPILRAQVPIGYSTILRRSEEEAS